MAGGRARRSMAGASFFMTAPMQAMFREHHALQCGFCTPGMVMSAIDIVQKHPEGLSEAQIREELEGNLCRCTGYHNIVKAIAAAFPLMHQKQAA